MKGRRRLLRVCALSALAIAGAVALLTVPRASSANTAPAALSRGLVSELATTAGQAGARVRVRLHEERRAARLAAAIREMPDLTQTVPELGVPGGGSSYCGPVAVSNALVGLAGQGFAELLPQRATPREAQLSLVRALGSGRYMGTSANSGTGAAGLMEGLQRYLRDRGVRGELSYQGWRGHPRRFASGVRHPSLADLRGAFAAGASVFVNIGWYTPSPRVAGVYRRRGGHWLTLAGSGVDASGDPAADTLVFHDPAPWAGDEGERHFAKFQALPEGWLITEEGPFPAAGHHALVGVHVKHAGDRAIVDGVVTLRLAADRAAGK